MPAAEMTRFFETRTTSLTFDDVLLQTAYADFYQSGVDFAGRLSRNVPLPLPIVGAAMSTVVGVPMAVALAKHGGIASMPRSLNPEAQAKAVARVKHHIHGFIDEPIFAYADETVSSFLARKAKYGWEFDSFPVRNREGGLFVGLMTHNNFKRCDDLNATIGSVMTGRQALVVARKGVTKQEAYKMLQHHDKNVLPVVQGDKFLGMYVFSDLKRILTETTNHNTDTQGRLRVMAAVGVGEEALARAELLVAKGVDAFHIDMAHGAQKSVVDTVRELRKRHPNGPDIVAGNISSYDGARALLEADIDGLIVGQGGGAICTTRIVAGIGQPQVSAIWACRDIAKGAGVPLCSDGGIRSSGDIVLALATGADCVMVGGMLAGTDEAPGEKLFHNGTYVKEFYGMGSLRAMRESSASRQRYLHTQGAFVPEGIEAVVPYKGAVGDILDQQVGGLRKGFHYAGARTLDDLHDKAWFEQTTPAGRAESHPHDVTMVAQAPNYRGMQS